MTNVAIFATLYPPAFLGGGPVRTLEALVRDAPISMHLSVLAPNKDLDGSDLAVESDIWIAKSGTDLLYAPVHKFSGLVKSFRMVRSTRPTVIYLNSFFNFRMSILPQLLSRLRFWGSAKVLLAPRGEFGEGALNVRRAKKRLYLFLYRALRLKTGLTWHASNDEEAFNVRRLWGEGARILVREDETNLPMSSAKPPRSDGTLLRVVFLGRIVRHKGLLIVIQALQESQATISLEIFGPEEDEVYVRECKAAANRCPSNIAIRFHGILRPEQVCEELVKEDVMVMPSAGENFGHVIAEALSVSCPVICSADTPWTDRLRAGGGVIVESKEPIAWKEAIELFAAASPDERFALRKTAGAVFDAWSSESKGPHVLDMMIC